MKNPIYFDTSALAKWYINESKSDEVEKYIQNHGPVDISEITVVEMRTLLARRRREKNISARIENKIFATFQDDIRLRFLNCHPLPSGLAAAAINLISVLSDIPLRTLDALHLVIAEEIQAGVLATADRIMARGAEKMNFNVIRFD